MHLEIIIDKITTGVVMLKKLLEDKKENENKINELILEIKKIEKENCIIDNTKK